MTGDEKRPPAATGKLDGTTRLPEKTRSLESTGIGQPTFAMEAGNRPDDRAPDLAVGTVLRQRFKILGVLGRGGMGTVYRATDLLKEEAHDRDTTIALKVLKPGIVDADITFMALQREARRAQQLAHPNIVTVYDFDRADDVIFMTMEFMRGRGLDSLLEDGKLPLDEVRRITREVAQGLAYAHKQKIVHADLKPENVFILDDGRVKILDFGIARAWQSEHRDFVEEAVAGCTPSYASPEVMSREQPSPADDVYALGCVIAQMASGDHPYDWHSGLEARKEQLKPVRPAGLKRREWRALSAALQLDRESRPADADAFLKRFSPSPVRATAWVVAVIAIIGAIAYSWFFQPEPGPEVPFSALSAELQDQITRNLQDADAFLAQGDINTSLQLYDMVLQSHAGNLDAVNGMNEATDLALERLLAAHAEGQISSDALKNTLRSLLDYDTLPGRARDQVSTAIEGIR